MRRLITHRLWHHILHAISIAAVAAVAIVVATRLVGAAVGSGQLARKLGALASEHLLDPATTRVRIGEVGGNLVTGAVLGDVRVEVRSGEAWVPFVSAREIDVDYRLGDLLRSRARVRLGAVRVVEPRIALPVRGGGGWPRLKARPAGGGPEGRRGVAVAIDRLTLERATVARDTLEAALDLAARLEIAGGAVALAIDSLAVRHGRFPPVVARGGVEVRGGAITLDGLELSTAGSRLTANGVVEGARGARLVLALDPLDLADAHAATGAALLEQAGWVRGTAALDGEWRNLELSIALSAERGRDRIDSLVALGRFTPAAVEIERLALSVNGVPFRGSGRLGLGPGSRDSYGTLAFAAVDLDQFPGLRDQPWMPPGTLSGTIKVASERRGAAGRERPFELDVTRGVVGGFVLAPGRFRGALRTDGLIRLDQYEVTTRGAVIRGAGQIDPRGQLALNQELEVSDLLALGGMLGERRFAGRGALRLALEGPVRTPSFAVEGVLDSLAAGPVRLAQADVRVAGGRVRPAFAFDFEATAASGTLAGIELDRLEIAGSYAGGRVEARSFTAGRGELEVRSAGAVQFSRGSVVFDLQELEATVKGEVWAGRGPVRAARQGKVWTIEGLRLAGGAGEVAFSGTFDPGNLGAATTDLDLRVAGLDLSDLSALRGSAVAGRVELSLSARGGADGLRLDFQAGADSLRLGRFAAARLEAAGGVHGDSIHLSRLHLERGGAVEVDGDIRFLRPIVDFRALRRLGAGGAWSTATVDLRVRAPELDLAAWRGVHPVLERLGGTVDLALALGGPAAAPDGSLTLRAAHLAVGEEDLGPVDARGRLAGGQLVLDELRFSLGGSPLAVRGSTPVRLRLTGLPALARDEPLDLRIELAQASLGAARYITDRVADAEGPVNGAIELSGSLAAPVFRGAADVAGGRLRVRGREETLEDLAGHIEFAGDRIRFTGVTATDGADGRLSAEGTIELRGLKVAGYEAVVKLERFQVESSGDYQAVLDGSFTLVRRGAGGLPEYTGSVVVRRLDYLREVVGRGAPAEPGPSSWVGHFDLDLPRNAWIRNMDLEVELKGQLTYEREVSGIVLLGRLETVRGRYDLFGHTFRITSGEIQFNDPVEIDPELNVTGETRIPEARIFATITGRASDRQVTLTSDPDYDQATLWKMLVPSGRGEVTSLVAMTPLVRELERSLSREIPGLSVSIESQTSETGEQPILGARVGKTIGSDLFLSAYQGFSSTSQQDVSVEYGLGTLFFLKGSAVRRGVTEGASQDIEQEYNIDLNLRFEF